MSVFAPNSIIFNDTDQAVRRLLAREVVAIPTETVYGLAGLGYDSEVISRIYHLKNRPSHNPLILHYARLEDTHRDVIWTPWAQHLAESFWPGPLTLVLALGDHSRIPLEATGGLRSAAIRVPSHPMIQTILGQLNGPLAAPSANLSGHLSPTTADHVARALPVPILDGGSCAYGIESTIIDGRSAPPTILRPGALSINEILQSLEDYRQDHPNWERHFWSEFRSGNHLGSEGITCPGQLSAHYAPKKRLRLNATSVCDHEGLLAFGPPIQGAKHIFQLSLEKNLAEAANKLFSGLHDLDQSSCTSIAVMPIPLDGIGCAIADRLSRAHAAFSGAPKLDRMDEI